MNRDMLHAMLTGAVLITSTSTAVAYPIGASVHAAPAVGAAPATPAQPWIDEVRAQVRALGQLDEDWTSYDLAPPNALAVEIALEVVDALALAGHRPAYVVPSADGGISIQYTSEQRAALVEISNAGGVAFMLQASIEAEPEFVDVERAEIGHRLNAFLF